MARRFAPNASVAASRYLIVPCEADGCGDGGVGGETAGHERSSWSGGSVDDRTMRQRCVKIGRMLFCGP